MPSKADYLIAQAMSKTAEDNAREISICPGCGKHKEIGLIVCWTCFKYREDVTPFKYADISLVKWLEKIPAKDFQTKIARSGLHRQ